MNKRNVLIMLGMLVFLCCMGIVTADCDGPVQKEGINVQSKVMDIKTIFTDHQGYTYVMDFDNNQQVFNNTSSSVIIKLKGIVGENGCYGVTLLYMYDCDGNCVLIDCYVILLDWNAILIALIIGLGVGIFFGIMFTI